MKVFILFFIIGWLWLHEVVANTARSAISVRSRNSYITLSLNYLWWQESVDLKTPGGEASPLLANVHGPCVGGGLKRFGRPFDYSADFCGFYGFTDVASQSRRLSYSQTAVPTYGAQLVAALGWRPQAGAVSVGLEGVGMIRKTEWTTPPRGHGVEGETKIAYGLNLDTSWRFHRYVIHMKVGQLWNLGRIWTLSVQALW